MNKKLELIQIFRGLASMLVVLCHLSGTTEKYFGASFLGGIFLKGYIGVDFFFVLSGFIITYVHLKDVINRSNKISFLKKRFIRIYPIYWIIASFYLFMLFLVNGKTNHSDHVMNFSSLSEWVYIISSYLLIPTKYAIFLPIAWSLCYEVLFYIAFYFFILLGFNRAKYIFFIWATVILLKVVLSNFYTLPSIIILNERILQFLSGCVVSYLILKAHYLSSRMWAILFTIGIVLIYLIYPNMLKEPSGILILAYFMGLIVYKIVEIDISSDRKYSRILLLVGEASYSIYLSHLIFLSILFRGFQIVVNKIQVQNFIWIQFIILLLFLLTIIGGILIFRFIETPVLRFFYKKL